MGPEEMLLSSQCPEEVQYQLPRPTGKQVHFLSFLCLPLNHSIGLVRKLDLCLCPPAAATGFIPAGCPLRSIPVQLQWWWESSSELFFFFFFFFAAVSQFTVSPPLGSLVARQLTYGDSWFASLSTEGSGSKSSEDKSFLPPSSASSLHFQ